MMKIHSIIHALPLPPRQPPHSPAGPLLAAHARIWKRARRGLPLEPFTGAGFGWGWAGSRAWRSGANVCTEPAGPLHRVPCG